MNNTLRLASLSAVLLASAVAPSGCVISDCPDGQDNCVQIEGTTLYQGSDENLSTAWASGQSITVFSDNGQVDLSVGSADEVSVTFKPSTRRAADEEEQAIAEMQNDITYTAGPDGSGVLVQADVHDGASGFLAADMSVKIPSNFDGDLIIDSDNGSITVNLGSITSSAIGAVSVDEGNGSVDLSFGAALPNGVTVNDKGAGDINVSGAAGPINLTGDFEVNLDVAEWAPVGSDGVIQRSSSLGNGDISIAVPAGANGSIQATACGSDGLVNGPASPPALWSEEAASPASKTFTFGDMAGAVLAVTCGDGIGNVNVTAK